MILCELFRANVIKTNIVKNILLENCLYPFDSLLKYVYIYKVVLWFEAVIITDSPQLLQKTWFFSYLILQSKN